MADKKISDLTSQSSISDSDLFEIENAGGNSRKAAATAIRDYVGLALISEQSPSGTGTVTFSSIPATYRDLELRIRGASSNASTDVVVTLRFNGDTGSNYDSEEAFFFSTGTVSATQSVAGTAINAGNLPGSTAPANTAGLCIVDIADYRGTTFHKAANSRGSEKKANSAGNVLATVGMGCWRNTAAITQIDAILSAGNWVPGSVVSLYGRT